MLIKSSWGFTSSASAGEMSLPATSVFWLVRSSGPITSILANASRPRPYYSVPQDTPETSGGKERKNNRIAIDVLQKAGRATDLSEGKPTTKIPYCSWNSNEKKNVFTFSGFHHVCNTESWKSRFSNSQYVNCIQQSNVEQFYSNKSQKGENRNHHATCETINRSQVGMRIHNNRIIASILGKIVIPQSLTVKRAYK